MIGKFIIENGWLLYWHSKCILKNRFRIGCFAIFNWSLWLYILKKTADSIWSSWEYWGEKKSIAVRIDQGGMLHRSWPEIDPNCDMRTLSSRYFDLSSTSTFNLSWLKFYRGDMQSKKCNDICCHEHWWVSRRSLFIYVNSSFILLICFRSTHASKFSYLHDIFML